MACGAGLVLDAAALAAGCLAGVFAGACFAAEPFAGAVLAGDACAFPPFLAGAADALPAFGSPLVALAGAACPVLADAGLDGAAFSVLAARVLAGWAFVFAGAFGAALEAVCGAFFAGAAFSGAALRGASAFCGAGFRFVSPGAALACPLSEPLALAADCLTGVFAGAFLAGDACAFPPFLTVAADALPDASALPVLGSALADACGAFRAVPDAAALPGAACATATGRLPFAGAALAAFVPACLRASALK